MNFDIEELKIHLFTNIRQPEYRTLEFKRSLLFHPDLHSTDALLNEYPYFTVDVKYPLTKLLNLEYTDRVEFFFDKDKFSEGLIAYASESDILERRNVFGTVNQDREEAEEAYYKQRTAHIEHNITAMLELLFPTRFPVINDLHTSYEMVMGKAQLKPLILNPIVPKYFSYLKLDHTYTFKKVIWINDLLNHPVYQKLLAQYMKYAQWHSEEKYRLMKTIHTNYAHLGKALPALFDEVYNPRSIAVFGLNREKMSNLLLLMLLTGPTRAEIVAKINSSTQIPPIEKEYYVLVLDEFLEVNLDIFSPDLEFTLDRYKKVAELVEDLRQKLPTYPVFAPLRSAETDKFLKALKMYTFVDSLLRKTLEDATKDGAAMGLSLPAAYRQFSYGTLSQYRRPARESSNAELQELIEGPDRERTTDFYRFMEYIYNQYIYSGIKPATDDRFNALLNVGASTVGLAEGPRREIYVYVDFIQGQVDATNVKKIFCPYVGDHLGNEFEFLTRLFFNRKTAEKYRKTWNINQNRNIFVIEENKEVTNVTGNAMPFLMKTEPLPPVPGPAAPPTGPVPINNVTSNANLNRLSTHFVSEIVLKNKDELTQRMKAVMDANPAENLNDQMLLPYIKQKEPYLYSAILEWNQDIDKRNQRLLDGAIRLGAHYEGEIRTREYAQKNNVLIKDDPEKVRVLQAEIKRYQLFMAVLKGLIANEEGKRATVGGAGRRARTKKAKRSKQSERKKHKKTRRSQRSTQ